MFIILTSKVRHV